MTSESLVKSEDFKVATVEPENLEMIFDELKQSGTDKFDLEKIKFPSDDETEWRLPDISQPSGYLRTDEIVGVIVHNHTARSYWVQDYDENPNQPPDCESNDGITGRYSESAFKDVEDYPSGECGEKTCGYAEFGTAKKGEGQACRLSRELYILLPNKLLPVMLSVGPGSVKDTRKFFMTLLSNGTSSSQVMMGLSLQTTKSSGGVTFPKLKMRVVGPLSDDMQAVVNKYRQLVQQNF